MSRLYWPQSTNPRRTSDENTPLDFITLLPMSTDAETQRPYFAHITQNIIETDLGDLEVVRATLQLGLVRDEIVSKLSVRSAERQVVCKVAYTPWRLDELKEEARLYEGPLAPLQGTVVPKCYGLFVGHSPDSQSDDREDHHNLYTLPLSGDVGVLVTEDCGSPQWSELKRCPKNYKQAALDALMKLHRAGVEHGNFNRRNIVTQSRYDVKSLRLTNFQSASEHECPSAGKTINFAREPYWGDIRCEELYNACMKAKLWLCTCCVNSRL